jgi:hypothetical protein
MELLRKEELRMADDTGRTDQSSLGGKSWWSRSFTSLLGSVVAKIASKFALTATKYALLYGFDVSADGIRHFCSVMFSLLTICCCFRTVSRCRCWCLCRLKRAPWCSSICGPSWSVRRFPAARRAKGQRVYTNIS